MAGRPMGFRALLDRGDYRALWAAGGLTLAVVPVLLVVLVWTVTQAFPASSSGDRGTAVALSLSLLGLSAAIPTLVAAVVSGTLADVWPRLRLMQAVNAAEILGILGTMAVFLVRPTAGVGVPGIAVPLPLYLVLLLPCWALVSTAATLFRPALNASMPRVVEASALGNANGLLYAFGLLVSVVGTLATPLLLTHAGTAWALVLPLGLLVVAQGGLAGISAPLDAPDRPMREPFARALVGGYAYLARRPALLQLTLASLAINFLSAIAFVELGLYVTIALGIQDPIYLGALYAGASVGAAVGAVAIGRIRFEPLAGRYLASLILAQGAIVLALVVIRSYPLALADLFLYGLVPGMAATVFFALVQATVRNEVLGRVLAADEVGSLALVPAGQYVGGLVTVAEGVSSTFLIGGVGILLSGLALAISPAVRRLGFEPGRAPQPPPGALLDAAGAGATVGVGPAPSDPP
ncbi:MAG TPA: MFS transporter [Thermoplasmata archaeon]|nr:MFS transporter [Thermoplasmata archaeon]